MTNVSEEVVNLGPRPVDPDVPHTVEFARCFLRLANLPNFALDRLSRYEATLWRQLRRLFLPSMPWIAENHKKEADVSLSTAGQYRRRLRTMNHTRHCATRPTVDHKTAVAEIGFVSSRRLGLSCSRRKRQVHCAGSAKACTSVHLPNDLTAITSNHYMS